ncbi:MAG: hypothetical protein ABFR75_06095 [Acidobacteriota bacterium]
MESIDLSIILPSAGEGKRFGPGGPKELFEIHKDIKMIDLSLQHISVFLHWVEKQKIRVDLKVVVVINRFKEKVIEHVKKIMPEVKVEKVYFNDLYREWPGSIYSAQGHFSDFNIVLLPDSFITMSKDNRFFDVSGDPLIKKMIDILKNSPLAFGVKRCKDPEILRNLGAVMAEDNKITEFQDKPENRFLKFNGYWGVFGFCEQIGEKVYNFLIRSVEHKNPSLKDYFSDPPGCFFLNSYMDLGTKDSVERLKNMFERANLLL